MELLGYTAAGLIGILLGMVGAGGGILTIPMMVYLFHVPVLVASSYSLAIVGFTSLLGATAKCKQGEIRIKTAFLLAITSMIVVLIVRRFVIPVVPHELFTLNGVSVESAAVSMVLFAGLMIAAAVLMIRRNNNKDENPKSASLNSLGLVLSGVTVGLLTGLLGAGGGFLLMPALVLFMGLPMKQAIGTSLLIISLNCLTGFAMDLSHFIIDWRLLSTVCIITGLGILAGISISKRISAQNLKVAFGWFVMIMGVVILFQELFSFFYKAGNYHESILIKLK